MKTNNRHEDFMREAIQEAMKANQKVSPNPKVGAVIVKNNQIISKGYHEIFGGPHAEVNAINNAKENIEGSTIYVSLQPCTHFGKTPPCTEAIIDHKIKHVFFAMLDPNPKVEAINGIRHLEKNNISVQFGLLKKDAESINQPFIKSFQSNIPYITAKYAMTLDGKIATSSMDSQWITNESSRKKVHQIRTNHDAILIGRKTFEADNPLLNIRYGLNDTNPYKVIIVNEFKAEYLNTKLCQQEKPNAIFLVKKNPINKTITTLKQKGIVLLPQLNSMSKTLAQLKSLGIQSILCEGGGELIGSLFDEDLIDQAEVFIGSKLIGGNGPSPIKGKGINLMIDAKSLQNIQVSQFENDIHLSGYLHFYENQK